MSHAMQPSRDPRRLARWSAWAVFAAWAAFWLWFNVVSAFSEIGAQGPMGVITHLIMPVLIVGAAYAVWRSDAVGGGILVALVVLLFVAFGWRGWTLALLLEAPPLLAGLLLPGIGRRRGATPDDPQPSGVR